MKNNIAPMPTHRPWAWVGMGVDTQCRALLEATSHTRLRARDQYAPSTLIGAKGGAGPSLLHARLEGPMDYVRECKMDVKFTWIPPCRPNTKPGDHDTLNAHNR